MKPTEMDSILPIAWNLTKTIRRSAIRWHATFIGSRPVNGNASKPKTSAQLRPRQNSPLQAKFATRGGGINDLDYIPSPEDLIEMLIWSLALVWERNAAT